MSNVVYRMPKFKVQKGIPIPTRKLTLKNRLREFMSDLEIGDSFVCNDHHMNSIRYALKGTAMEIMTHEERWTSTGRINRIWRTK